MAMDLNKFSQALLSQKKPVVVATVIGIKGSAPQNLGSKMIVSQEGLEWGTVGGGKIEAHCLGFAREFLATNESVVIKSWNLQKDIKMTCGGEMSFMFEKSTPWNIAIFGAGHVSQALVRTLLKLNCQLYVFDTREEWISKLPQDAKLKARVVEDLATQLDHIPQDTFVCSMTMGHAHDVPILKRALEEFNFPYYGVIGSQQKRNAILKDLGMPEADFHCPMGEKIGSNDPFEIAISITAELLKCRDQ